MTRGPGSTDKALVTLSQIAELAHVGASAVSNWRKRYSDFPRPTSSAPGGRDLWSLDAVEEWLRRNDRLHRAASPEGLVFRAADIVRSATSSDQLIRALCAALALAYRHRLPGRPKPPADSQALVQQAISDDPEITGIFEPLLDLPPQTADRLLDLVLELDRPHIRRAFEWVLTRRDRFTETRSAEVLTDLMAELGSGPVVFDPAAGEGGFLLRAFQNGARQLYGQEINESALRIARQRFMVHEADARLALGDSLRSDRFATLRADTVCCDPPYGLRLDPGTLDVGEPRWAFGPPTTQTADYAWLQHVIHHLNADGRGYVLLPAGSLYRGGREADIRREMVRRGAVEAVVGLPQGIAERTGVPLALWIVRPPLADAERAQILFIDGSGSGSGVRALDHDGVGEIARLVREWRTTQRLTHGDPRFAASAPLLDVVEAETNLLPSRWVRAASARSAAEVRQEIVDLSHALDEGRRSLASLAPMSEEVAPIRPSSSSWITVRTVVADGLGEVIRGTKVREEDCGSQGVRILRTRDVAEGLNTSTEPCYVDPESLGPTVRLTQPGDIIVSPGGGVPRATVDDLGGNVLASPLQALRIRDGWIAPELAAAFLQSPRNRRFVAGTAYGYARLDLRDLEMPLLPKADAKRLLRAIRHARHAEQLAASLADQARAIRDALVEAAYSATDPSRNLSGDNR